MATVKELDPEMIERVEVVKGQAARVVFGEEAATGQAPTLRRPPPWPPAGRPGP